MKLAFIEIAGFRGFKGKTRFDLPGGFAVLTGRNGVGKSTVLDAVDFALTGTINKYSVRDAKGGGLDDHIWWVGEGPPESQYVRVGFVDEDGEELVVKRSRGSGVEAHLEYVANQLCLSGQPAATWLATLMQTTLIRDETIAGFSLDLPEQARFAAVRDAIGGLIGPDHAKRTSILLGTATSAKNEQDRRVADARAELGRALGALTEARGLEAEQPDVAEAESIVKTLAPDLLGGPGSRAEMLRGRVAAMRQAISVLADLLIRAETILAQRDAFESEAGLAAIESARNDCATRRQAKELADESLASAERLKAVEWERDTFAATMMALLEHGEAVGLQDGHCPLCDAVRSSREFTTAIVAARARVSSREEGTSRAATQVEQARLHVERSGLALAEAMQRVELLEERRKDLARATEDLASALTPFHLGESPFDIPGIQRLFLQRQEDAARLEHALFVLEASSAHDRVVGLEVRIERLREQLEEEIGKLDRTERAVDMARQIDYAAREVPNQLLTEQFDTVMPLLKELYRRLRPHAEWREIDTDFGGRVRASLNFTVGDGLNPQFLFSSGQRRAAGVAFLLAIHLSRPWCRLRTLMLDDHVQHIDDYRALNLVEVLSAVRRTGRQIIIAVEDPNLADVLCRRLRSTTLDPGRLFELSTMKDGSSGIASQAEIVPLPREVLKVADG